MKKYILVPIIILVLAGGTFWVVSPAVAQTVQSTTNPMVSRLAQRLNLSEKEVQEVMDEVHAERYALKMQKFEDKLALMVDDGKITEVQRDALLQKREELEDKWAENRTLYRTMNSEQKKSAHKQHKAELEAWAKEQGINISDFFPSNMRRRMY